MFGMRYYFKRRFSRDWESMSGTHLWAGCEFGKRVVRGGFGKAGAVYTFNTAALEILCAARESGMYTALEQTIAPRAYEEELIAEEQSRFPGWEKIRRCGHYTQEAIHREAEEWSLADVILCGSEFVKNGLSHCGGPTQRCVVVPYGVDERFAFLSRPPRKGPLRVLTVGEAGLRKGITYAYEVAKIMGAAAEFRWVGPVSLRPQVRARVRNHVQLTGVVPRSEILPHFQWADVFFLPSVCEGSATATYEAMLSGLPVVTTFNAGTLVRDEVEGFVVPVRNTTVMAERLLRLHDNPELLISMRHAVSNRAETASLEAYQNRLLDVLCNLRAD
jgi:glycosyltransferase involved in cell wall biosynthesis